MAKEPELAVVQDGAKRYGLPAKVKIKNVPAYKSYKHGRFAKVPALCKFCIFGGNEEVGGTNQCPKYDPDPEAVCTVRGDIKKLVDQYDTRNRGGLSDFVDGMLKDLSVSVVFANTVSQWQGGTLDSKANSTLNTWIRMAQLAKELHATTKIEAKAEYKTEMMDVANELFSPAASKTESRSVTVERN